MKTFILFIAIVAACASMELIKSHSLIDRSHLRTFNINENTVIP